MLNTQDTIAAIATAQAVGGIGIIRVSGENSIKICNEIFESITTQNDKLLNAKGYTVHYGKIVFNNECIDEVLVTVFRNPHSYTGEDVVEISCHGGLYITKRVLETVIMSGARLAEAGEFTKRAFLNGKLGLTQAESIMNIISANGKVSAQAAMNAKDGALYKKISSINERLIDLAAHLSAWADYPEEDIIDIDETIIETSLTDCKREMESLISTYETGRIMRDGISTAIVGRPNVGKSTLMNLLSGCERSIVTNIPGTTRDIVEETVMLGDICLRLADTAGIRDTSDKVEHIGVQKALKQINSSELIFAVFDSSEKLTNEDLELIDFIKEKNSIAIINKTDLERKIDLSYLKDHVDKVVEISAHNGNGLNALTSTVSDLIGLSQLDPSQAIIATERQKFSATMALKSINESLEAVRNGMTFDAITVSVEDAIQHLLELTGERVSEKVVDRVFSRFCVGK